MVVETLCSYYTFFFLCLYLLLCSNYLLCLDLCVMYLWLLVNGFRYEECFRLVQVDYKFYAA